MPWYERPTQAQTEFARIVLRQWLIAVPFAVGLLLVPICIETLRSGLHARIGSIPVTIYCWLLFPIEGGLFGLASWNWRCPGCHGFLGMDAHPCVCARCGAVLGREQHSPVSNPFWKMMHLSLKALRVAHDVLHGLVFMVLGGCLGGIGGVWLGEHLAPRSVTPFMLSGIAMGLIAGGVTALGALRQR